MAQSLYRKYRPQVFEDVVGQEHVERTQSPRGIKLLYQFAEARKHFVKVVPHEYRLVMERADVEQASGVSREEAIELAFESLRKEA